MAYKALYNLFPDTSLISSPTILAHSAPADMASLLFPQLIKYALTSSVFILTVPSAWNPLLRDILIACSLTLFRSLCSNITMSEKPSLSALHKTAYISPFSLYPVLFVFLTFINYLLSVPSLPFSRI